ncbi:universal stress protein PHOS32-like isoform X2 [Apium graveolens]|uniref:universal stress protein PHOS32-like isoform X2 n=1 Tax=Apium graveolens TaxID=4045 RepID=UPI003D7A928C
METVMEDEDYKWTEVKLPSIHPEPEPESEPESEPELERGTAERRRGRDIVIAIDHGHNSKHAFDWAIAHFCRLADTIYLVHAISDLKNEVVYVATQGLMEKLALEAMEVKTKARIVEGDAGKAICKVAEKLKPAAVVMGTRSRSLMQSVVQGSVSEYCVHHCKSSPLVIVPGIEVGEESII